MSPSTVFYKEICSPAPHMFQIATNMCNWRRAHSKEIISFLRARSKEIMSFLTRGGSTVRKSSISLLEEGSQTGNHQFPHWRTLHSKKIIDFLTGGGSEPVWTSKSWTPLTPNAKVPLFCQFCSVFLRVGVTKYRILQGKMLPGSVTGSTYLSRALQQHR